MYEPTTHCRTMSAISKVFYIKKKAIIVPNVKKISKIPFNLLNIQTKYGDSLKPRENSVTLFKHQNAIANFKEQNDQKLSMFYSCLNTINFDLHYIYIYYVIILMSKIT